MNESPRATLPGRLYRKRGRWWWKVQLPGEKSTRGRALKPQGSKRATTDRQLADEIVLTLWQEAIQAQAEALVRAEQTVRIQRLRRHFRQKIKALQDVIESAEARAEAETAERAKLEVKLNGLWNQLTQTTSCDCCGRSVPQSELLLIDSGQRLCPGCLADLRRAAQRQASQQPKTPNAAQNSGDADPGTLGRSSSRDLSSIACSASFAGREDSLSRRNIHGSDVLYAKAGSR
jgi:hypothetical protein